MPKKRLAILCFYLLAIFAVPRLLDAQTTPAAASAGKHEMHSKSLLDMYRDGGWVMHIIAACSIGTIAVMTFCVLQINRRKLLPTHVVAELNRQMADRDLNAAFHLCRGQPNVLTRTLGAALIKANPDREHDNKPAMEQAASETLYHEETRYMLWVNMLNAFATIAPMVGLLGTVSGMISSFGVLASGRSEASDFAGGIGEAMVGTAGGLLVAIPAMFGYFLFRNALQGCLVDVQKAISNMLDLFTGEITLGTLEMAGAQGAGTESAPTEAA
jgi:biopolymer transport protein ExbB